MDAKADNEYDFQKELSDAAKGRFEENSKWRRDFVEQVQATILNYVKQSHVSKDGRLHIKFNVICDSSAQAAQAVNLADWPEGFQLSSEYVLEISASTNTAIFSLTIDHSGL